MNSTIPFHRQSLAILVVIIGTLPAMSLQTRPIKNDQDYRDALYKLQYEAKVKDSVNKARLEAKEAAIRQQFEIDEKEQLVKTLEAKNRSNSIIILLFALMTGTGIGILAMIMSLQRIHTRRKTTLSNLEKKRLEAEIELKKLNERKLQEDLAFRAKELTTFTLNLVQKNELMESIKKEITEIRKKADTSLKAKLAKLTTKINLSISAARNWEYFRMYFEKIHSGFFSAVSARFPDLNRNDLRLCALLKLGLDTKQIAVIMEISYESAKVAKHRLRKKLSMKPEQGYQEFFAELHPESAVNPDLSDLAFLFKTTEKNDDDF